MRSTRLWGALLVAILATAAQCFDRVCERTLGTSLGCISLLLIVGLITSCIRQVSIMHCRFHALPSGLSVSMLAHVAMVSIPCVDILT